jgi:hypothetical protein
VGDHGGLDDDRAGEVVEDVAKVANLFMKAAEAGQAVVVAIYA